MPDSAPKKLNNEPRFKIVNGSSSDSGFSGNEQLRVTKIHVCQAMAISNSLLLMCDSTIMATMPIKIFTQEIPFQFQEPVNLFAVPAGRYRATLESITYCDHKGQHDDMKFLFDITANEHGPVDYRARKLFCNDKTSHAQLQRLLKVFYTAEEIEILTQNGTEIDLNDLQGRSVDLLIVTKNVSGYKTPFSEIDGAYQVGTLLPDPISGEEPIYAI